MPSVPSRELLTLRGPQLVARIHLLACRPTPRHGSRCGPDSGTAENSSRDNEDAGPTGFLQGLHHVRVGSLQFRDRPNDIDQLCHWPLRNRRCPGATTAGFDIVRPASPRTTIRLPANRTNGVFSRISSTKQDDFRSFRPWRRVPSGWAVESTVCTANSSFSTSPATTGSFGRALRISRKAPYRVSALSLSSSANQGFVTGGLVHRGQRGEGPQTEGGFIGGDGRQGLGRLRRRSCRPRPRRRRSELRYCRTKVPRTGS